MSLHPLPYSPSLSTLVEETFCVSVIDAQGNLTYVNDKFCELTNYSEKELIGQTWALLNKGLCVKSLLSYFQFHFKKEKTYQQSVKIRTKDNKAYWLNVIIVPVYNDKKEITHYMSLDIDITGTELASQEYEKTRVNLKNIEYALDQASVVAITNPQGMITYVNDKFCELSKYSREELIGKTHRVVNSGTHPKSFFRNMWTTIRNGDVWRGEICNRAKDGSYYWVNTTIIPFLGHDGKPYQYISIRTDITARKKAERSLEIALKNDFTTTVKNLQNGIFKYTLNENNQIAFTLFEGKITEKLGVSKETLNEYRDLGDDSPFNNHQVRRHLLRGWLGHAIQFEIEYNGHTFLVYLSPIWEGQSVTEVVGTAIDITERKEAERLVERMAFYDYLTDLPNRRLFKMAVEETIEKYKLANDTFAVLFIDLDRFKNINDSMGHYVGDQLLIAVGERLKQIVRKHDMVARLSGDEFTILFSPATKDDVRKIAERIVAEVAESYLIGHLEVFVAPSIGISMYPKDGEDYDTLLRNADYAMYLAKESGKSTYQFFTRALYNDLVERTLIEMELRQALQKNEFSLHYQPQLDFVTGEIQGVEALLRWNHSKRGLISPVQFIPIAEETGLILPIGQWVLQTACQQAKAWQDAGHPPIRMSVNVSLRQFKSPTFISEVKETLYQTGLSPQYLNIEITESMTSDVEHCQQILQELREIGIKTSIDDFGTGYSSLSYLSRFPITHLKIDKSFVQELNNNNSVIVKAIIDLAKNLHLRVIAEGVETEEQAAFLRDLGCDEAQGYLFSKPLPNKEIEQLFLNT